MKKLFIFAIALLAVQNCLLAQANNNKTLFGEIELGYGFGLSDQSTSYNLSYDNFSGRMYLANFRAKAGYYLTPQISLGLGIGLNGYHNTNINTLPVVIDLQYHLKSMSNLFTYVNIGASIAPSDAYTSGFVSDIGLGYRITLGKRILKPSVGYDLFRYSQNLGIDSETHIRHTLFMRLGFEF
ncbi:hypothetical protein AGMMS49982_12700 [Bacteroidia bacterium]|nr:hypothetical protein AGMMS49982_12700 [Bacteroidia bacterium]